MTVAEFTADLKVAEGLVQQGLTTVAELDPAADLPIAAAEAVLPLLEQLVNSALTAWSNASGEPITVESVQALLPNPTPLTPPAAS